MTRSVYLDYNAAAPVRPEAVAAARAALDLAANPSSAHAAGREARQRVETARRAVAALAGGSAERLIFTSGGSEANTLAVLSAARAGCGRLILSDMEHASVREAAAAAGLPTERLPVDAEGVADLDWLQRRLRDWPLSDGRPFVALMAASHETGVAQPVAEASRLVSGAGGWLHVDAIGAAGKRPLNMAALGAHTLALAAAKIGGAAGSGALLYADGVILSRQIHGGGQERALRGGTENLAGVAAFGAAALASSQDLRAGADPSMEAAMAAAVARVKAAGALIIGEGALRVPGVVCLAAPGVPAAVQVMALDLEGVMVSAGAACSSGRVEPSFALKAMGLGDLAGSAIRASSGWRTSLQDWSDFAEVFIAAGARLTARRRLKECA